MSQNIAAMAARLHRDVPNAEGSIDDALIAVASLTTSVVMARRAIGAPAKTGQGTIMRRPGTICANARPLPTRRSFRFRRLHEAN